MTISKEEFKKWREESGLDRHWGTEAIDVPEPIDSISDQPITLWPTGWPELDAIWQLSPGQFTVLTGRTGCGKSMFLFNLLLQMAVWHGHHSTFWIPENEPTIRFISRELYHWGATENADAAARYVRQNQWFYQPSTPDSYKNKPQTIQTVLDRIAARIEDDEISVVVLDPWNELERAKPKDQLLTDYIGDCLMYARRWAQQWQVALILVAHPTKIGAQQDVSLYDIAGSANFANKPDVGLSIERRFGGYGDLPSTTVGQFAGTAQLSCVKSRDARAAKIGMCEFQVTERGIFIPFQGTGIHDNSPSRQRKRA